jgi:hypothetical protein
LQADQAGYIVDQRRRFDLAQPISDLLRDRFMTMGRQLALGEIPIIACRITRHFRGTGPTAKERCNEMSPPSAKSSSDSSHPPGQEIVNRL